MSQLQSMILMLTVSLPTVAGFVHGAPIHGSRRFGSAEQRGNSTRYSRLAQASSYGLKGDGITDDSDSLQRAIDAIPAGGLLQIPPTASIRLTKTIFVYGKSGLTIEGYAEIGKRLLVSTETVKFHFRRIFLKFGVRRRTELVSRLLMPESEPEQLDRS